MDRFIALDWDSDFFGYPVAQVNSSSNKTEEWNNILAEITFEGITLAYWQVKPDNYSFQQFAKKNQGKLVDNKTTYSIQLTTDNNLSDKCIEILDDKEPNVQLLNLAIQCGAYSRFAIDKNIQHDKFEELYRLWMINSLKKTMADDVLVYKLQNTIVGLVTVYEKNNIGNIGLIGVDEEYRGKGIGKALLTAVKNYFSAKGIHQINVVTQGQNLSACKLYENAGFTVLESSEFYHFWLK